MTVLAVALCCLTALFRVSSGSSVVTPAGGTVEAKSMVGVVILELYAKQMENLAQLLANTKLEKCPAHRSNPQLAQVIKSLSDFKTVGQSSISKHIRKLARDQWKIYLQPISENMQKLASWISAAPESSCLNEHVLEVFAVQSADIVGGLTASTDLLRKLTATLDGSDDYRSDFFTAYQTYLSELVDTLEKVKNDETVICAVISEDGAPAYSKILDAVIGFLKMSHPAIIAQEKSTVTMFLAANADALNALINGADTHAKSALSKAMTLKEKCTDPELKESHFAGIFSHNAHLWTYGNLMSRLYGEHTLLSKAKPNPLVPVAMNLERAWQEVDSKTKSVLQHCTMDTVIGAVQDDC